MSWQKKKLPLVLVVGKRTKRWQKIFKYKDMYKTNMPLDTRGGRYSAAFSKVTAFRAILKAAASNRCKGTDYEKPWRTVLCYGFTSTLIAVRSSMAL